MQKITEHIAYIDKLIQAAKSYSKITELEIGTSPRMLLHKQHNNRLYYYQSTKKNKKPALLIIFSLINYPSILDLSTNCSFIQDMVNKGIDIFLIEWGTPGIDDAHLSLTDYIAVYLHNYVDICKKIIGQPKINILGICQGGVFSLCYSALFPNDVKNLILITTPVDFHTEENILWKLFKDININLLTKTFGNIPGVFLQRIFISLKPFSLLGKKYLNFLDIVDDNDAAQRFLKIEKWLQNSPDQAGRAFNEFVNGCYKKNGLIKGELEIANRMVNLNCLNMPILNIIANNDYLVPNNSSLALSEFIQVKDYAICQIPGGHIGIYIKNESRRKLCDEIAKWLTGRI